MKHVEDQYGEIMFAIFVFFQGLYVEAEELVLRNLPSVKYFYGDASVEVGNELQKLIDVQVAIIEKSAIHNVEK